MEFTWDMHPSAKTNDMNKLNLLATLCLAFAACGGPSHQASEYNSLDNMGAKVANAPLETEVAFAAPEERVSNNPEPAPQRRVIKEGYITFESHALAETRQRIDSILRQCDGHIDADREYSIPGRISHTLTVRVPSDRFETFVDALSEGVGVFEDKSITSRDVTAEYIDVVARMKTKKELEQRYLDLLRQANSLKEIIDIETALGNIRAEIESMEGQIRYLTHQTDYATLQLTYYKTVANKPVFGNKFSNGFVNGWNNLIWFFVGLVNIWPFVILLPLGILLIIRWVKRRRAKRGAANP